MAHTHEFNGFYPQTTTFLETLRETNSKPWYEDNKELYEKLVLHPQRGLVETLGPFMMAIDPQLEVRPSINKTISRIFRDTRFSKDKTLFKNNAFIKFKKPRKDWKERPSFYFGIFPDFYSTGMGYFHAPPSFMEEFRKELVKNPKKFLEVTKPLKKLDFTIAGNAFKRPKKADLPEELLDWYNMKTFYVAVRKPLGEELYSKKVIKDIQTVFAATAPLYHYLWSLHQKLDERT